MRGRLERFTVGCVHRWPGTQFGREKSPCGDILTISIANPHKVSTPSQFGTRPDEGVLAAFFHVSTMTFLRPPHFERGGGEAGPGHLCVLVPCSCLPVFRPCFVSTGRGCWSLFPVPPALSDLHASSCSCSSSSSNSDVLGHKTTTWNY